jgi:histidyl-tRNA synthetase
MERLALIPAAEGESAQTRRCEVFLVPLAPGALDRALLAQRGLRAAGRSALLDHEGRGLKSQMKKADKLGARFVAILGEDEQARGVWTVRNMASSAQEEVPEARLAEYFRERLDG